LWQRRLGNTGKAGMWPLHLYCILAVTTLLGPSPLTCGRGTFLPLWIRQFSSLFENLKMLDHDERYDLDLFPPLTIAHKVNENTKHPPPAKIQKSCSGGIAISLGWN
jgi:hypothetical protein